MTKSRVLAGYVAIESTHHKMLRIALFTEENSYFQISVGDDVLARIREIHNRETANTRGDHDASSQAFDIPLEGARQGLVEIIQVEDQLTIGSAIPSKVA